MKNEERIFNQSAGKTDNSRGPVTPGLSPGYKHQFRLKHEKNQAEAAHKHNSAVPYKVCAAHLCHSQSLSHLVVLQSGLTSVNRFTTDIPAEGGDQSGF